MDGAQQMSDADWKRKLTHEQYQVLRKKGTEKAFTGKFYKNFETGMYHCAGCGQTLFSSDTKFDSDCGWPSFDESLDKTHVILKDDDSLGMRRTEVVCSNCGGHLGHLFDDGPTKTRLRYCINSAALDFKPHSKEK